VAPAPSRHDELPIAPNLARIPAGDFLMGAADAEEDERPVHRVFVSEFFIGRYPSPTKSTRGSSVQPGAVAGRARAAARRAGDREPAFRELPRLMSGVTCAATRQSGHPVVLVSYEDATSFCQWLSDTIERRVRLPTEGEWEKAARGGARA
jgi:formylglycine-generating enzyme required for sulfatase activity